MSSRTPFFIVGASRSGTGLLRLMLNAHSRLTVPPESWFLTDLMDHLPLRDPLSEASVKTALSIIEGHWRWKEWGVDNLKLREAVGSLEHPVLADVIGAAFALTGTAAAGTRWGDKTPGYTTEITRLHQVFPQAQFVHIIRDGRDVCISLKKTGWHGEATWTIADYWNSTVSAGCEAGRSLPAGLYKEIAYEDLVLDSESVLQTVSEFLGVKFEPAMRDFFKTASQHMPGRSEGSKVHRPPRETDVRRWEREQRRHETVIFEAFAGRTLAQLGYDRTAQNGLAFVRVLCRSIEAVASGSLPLRRRLGLHFPGWRKAL